MKRRDFNRMALGIGLSPMLTDRSLAQWYEGPSPPTQPPPQKFNIVIKHSPRTYNQVCHGNPPLVVDLRSIGRGAIPGRPIAM